MRTAYMKFADSRIALSGPESPTLPQESEDGTACFSKARF